VGYAGLRTCPAHGCRLGGLARDLGPCKTRTIAAETSAIQQTQHRAIAFEQYVARTLQAADLASQHVAQRYLLTDGSQQLDLSGTRPVVISDALARAPTFSAVTIVNARGDLLATTRPRAAKPAYVSKHPVFRALAGLQDNRLQISPPLDSALLPGKFIYLTRRVASSDGKTLGYVGVMLKPVELSRFMQDASFRSTDLISVIGLDGITRARREGQRFTAGEDLRNQSRAAWALAYQSAEPLWNIMAGRSGSKRPAREAPRSASQSGGALTHARRSRNARKHSFSPEPGRLSTSRRHRCPSR
jgi:hypothetical protein